MAATAIRTLWFLLLSPLSFSLVDSLSIVLPVLFHVGFSAGPICCDSGLVHKSRYLVVNSVY